MPLLLTAAGPGAPGEVLPPDPPDAPSNLMLDGTPTTTGAGVTWAAPGGGGSIDNYRVQAQVAGGDWSSPVVNGTAADTSAALTGLSANTSYDVRVRAEGPGGDSAWVTEEDLVLTLPTAPTITSVANGNTSITIGWTPGAGLTYKTYRNTVDDFGTATETATGQTGPSYVFTGLTNGTEYFVWLVANNATGDSAESASASGTPEAAGVITFRAAGSISTGTNVAVPAGTASGDLLVAFVTSSGGAAAPAGWTAVLTNHTWALGYKTGLFVKIATGSEPSTYNFGLSGAGQSGVMLAYENASGIYNVGSWEELSGTSLEYDGVAGTTGTMQMIVTAQVESRAVTPPAGFTERVDNVGTIFWLHVSELYEGDGSNRTVTRAAGSFPMVGVVLNLAP